MKNKKGKGKKMKVKELIDRLEGAEFDKNDSVQFYFLENNNLEGCELETILYAMDGERVEITIKPYCTDDGGNSTLI